MVKFSNGKPDRTDRYYCEKDKKAIAIEFINKFYDTTFNIVDIPVVPNILEPIIHSYVKQILMIMVSASIDATVSIFRQTGIFLKKG